MKYLKCCNCDFNVTSEIEHCPYCGVWHPLESSVVKEVSDEKNFADTVGGVIFVILVLPTIPFYILDFLHGFRSGISTLGAFISWFIFSILLSFLISIPIVKIVKGVAKKKIVKSRSDINERRILYSESLSFKKTLTLCATFLTTLI